MKTLMGGVEKYSNHQLDKMQYAQHLYDRQQAGEDISWRNRRDDGAGYQGGYGGHQGGYGGHQGGYGGHQGGYGGHRYEPAGHFPSPPPPPRPQPYQRDADMHSQFGDVHSERDVEEQEPRRPQDPRQMMEQHLAGLPDMIQNMLGGFMDEMTARMDELTQRVAQLERGGPAPQAQHQEPSLPHEEQELPFRDPSTFPPPPRHHSRRPSAFGDSLRQQVQAQDAPPALPLRSKPKAQDPTAKPQVTLPPGPPPTLPPRGGPGGPGATPVRRKAVPDQTATTQQREPVRRDSMSTTSEVEEEQRQEFEQQQEVDQNSSTDGTHDRHDRFRTRPVAADLGTTGGGAAGTSAAIDNHLGAMTLEQQLTNVKVQSNFAHQGLDAAERLSRG
ncbi:hypothetical protein [Herbaspirillum sp. YR522]|uniref:hypothetical protein n=1 Tax=Herbaspirillum sp. YR522 TaxID=1144342 RepID=UPI00187234EB|nr:hypothetical protein [Herbaspirillum sp. YR522]